MLVNNNAEKEQFNVKDNLIFYLEVKLFMHMKILNLEGNVICYVNKGFCS